MGLLTLPDFDDELDFSLQRRNDVSAAQRRRWINFAYRHITLPSVFRHAELEQSEGITLIADTSDYALANSIYHIDTVFDEELGKDIDSTSFERILERRRPTNTTRTGRPSLYARRNQTIYFNVAPDASALGDTVTVYEYVRPTALAGTATTVVEEYWDQVIIDLALYYAWIRLGQLDRADFHRETATALINEHTHYLIHEARDDGEGIEISYAEARDLGVAMRGPER